MYNIHIMVIIEFEPNSILLSYPPYWWLYYRQENEFNFQKISVTRQQLIAFLETYGYEINNLLLLKQFGVNTTNIKEN